MKSFFTFSGLFVILLCGSYLMGMEGGDEQLRQKRHRNEESLEEGKCSKRPKRKKSFIKDLYTAFCNQEWDRIESKLNDGGHLNFSYAKRPFIQILLERLLYNGDVLAFIYAIEEGADVNARTEASGDTIFACLIEKLTEAYLGLFSAKSINTYGDLLNGSADLGLKTIPDRINRRLLNSIKMLHEEFQKAIQEEYSKRDSSVTFIAGFIQLFMGTLLEAGAQPVINFAALNRFEQRIERHPYLCLLLRVFLEEGGSLDHLPFSRFPNLFDSICGKREIFKAVLMNRLEAVTEYIENNKDAMKDKDVVLIEAFLLAVGQQHEEIAQKLHQAYTFDQITLLRAFITTAGTGNEELFKWLITQLDPTHSDFATTINRALARIIGQNNANLYPPLSAQYDLRTLITQENLVRLMRFAGRNGNESLFLDLAALASKMKINIVPFLGTILLEAAIRGDVYLVRVLLDYDELHLNNLGIDLNPAGLRITAALGNMHLTIGLRSSYTRIRRMLQDHLLIRRMRRLMLLSLERDPVHGRVVDDTVPALPVELHRNIAYLASYTRSRRPVGDMNAAFNAYARALPQPPTQALVPDQMILT